MPSGNGLAFEIERMVNGVGLVGLAGAQLISIPTKMVAAVTRIRMSETSVSTSEPGGQGVAQSGVGAISHPGDVPVRADHHGDRGAD